MAKYRTADGVEFEAANDAAAGRYIDGQLAKRSQTANVAPAAMPPPGSSASVAQPPAQAPAPMPMPPAGLPQGPQSQPGGGNPIEQKDQDEFSALLRGDQVLRARVEGREAGRRMGPAGTAGMALQQGTLRNFGDEIGAAGAASGLPVGTPPILSAPIGALRLAYGDKGAGDQYDQTLARLRGAYEGASSKNPVTSTVGEMVGGLAGPMPGGSIPAMATTAAGDAAIAGAGAGETTEQRATGAGIGAAVGGVFGSALGYAGKLIGRGASATADQVEAEAARRVSGAREIDLAALTPAERTARMQGLDAAYVRGQPVMNADVGDEATRSLARAEANRSPDAFRTIKDATGERFETQATRARSWWDDVTGAPNALSTQDALKRTARAENAPRYKAAYEKGQVVWDRDLQELSSSPTIKQAIMNASKLSADDAALHGTPMVRNPFTMGDDGALMLQEGMAPNLQFWDHVQRGLRRAEDAAPKGGDEARNIAQLRGALNSKLDAAVPEFAEARSVAKGFFGAEDALDAGRGFLDIPARAGSSEAQAAYAKLNPSEKKLFASGVVESVRDRLGAVADNQEVSRLFNNPEMRDRLTLALGPDRTKQLQDFMQVEKTMSQFKNALGNSTTAKQLVDLGVVGQAGVGAALGGGVGAAGSFLDSHGNPQIPSAAAVAGLLGGALVGHNRKVNVNVANRVAEMLTSPDPTVLQRGLNVLSRNSALKESFNKFAGSLSRAAGQQMGGAFGSAQ